MCCNCVCVFVDFRRYGEPGGDGGEDEVNKSGFGTSAHTGR